MTHGGARLNAGRPEVQIDEKRVMALIRQGISQREIAKRFGVGQQVIWYRVNKLKRGNHDA